MQRAGKGFDVPSKGIAQLLATGLGRLVASIFVPLITFIGLWQGFLFLRDSDAPKLVVVVVAIVWGVGFWRKNAAGRAWLVRACRVRSTKKTPKCWAVSLGTRIPMPVTSALTVGMSVVSKSSQTSPEVTSAAALGPASARTSRYAGIWKSASTWSVRRGLKPSTGGSGMKALPRAA